VILHAWCSFGRVWYKNRLYFWFIIATELTLYKKETRDVRYDKAVRRKINVTEGEINLLCT